jgi:hypothetical protein
MLFAQDEENQRRLLTARDGIIIDNIGRYGDICQIVGELCSLDMMGSNRQQESISASTGVLD